MRMTLDELNKKIAQYNQTVEKLHALEKEIMPALEERGISEDSEPFRPEDPLAIRPWDMFGYFDPENIEKAISIIKKFEEEVGEAPEPWEIVRDM